MKSKGCLTTILVIFVILIGISFFLPKDMNIAHTETLEASPEQLFYQVNDTKRWKDWSPWFSMDDSMKVEYSSRSVGEGAYYNWKSKKKFVGNGKMTINESLVNKKIGTTLDFSDGDGGTANFTFNPNGAGTDVEWSFASDYKPKIWQKYNNAFNRLMLKNFYKKGLNSLETYVKANPEAHIFKNPHPEIKIEATSMEAFNGVTAVMEGKWSDFGSQVYAEGFGKAISQVMKEELEISGYPFGKWIEWDTSANQYKIELGVPVKSGGKSFKPVDAIKASYYGNYEGMDAAYIALEVYGDYYGFGMGMPYEVFITDPTLEPDTSKWLTEIYFPIE